MDDRRNALEQLLEAQYGISSVGELNEAIREIGVIDISLFCTIAVTNEKEAHEK